MKGALAGKVVLLTGASGGLGQYIARSLAKERVRMILNAYPGEGLAPLRDEIESLGIEVRSIVADCRETGEVTRLAEEAIRAFGGVDILINNAGVEFTSPLHELSEAELGDVIKVNLEAPMRLTRALLPGMLARGGGHIVNMSSLAGRSGPAYQEPYAATKAGLVAFTQSLRGSYRDHGVSASVICPGFVSAGIYARIVERSGCRAPLLLAATAPERVGKAVLRAIRCDLPEVIVNRWPIRPLLALSAVFPRWGEWITGRTGAHLFFRAVYQAQAGTKSDNPSKR